MDHTEARRLMASERYVLGELAGRQQDEFEEHYFDCRECAQDVRLAVTFVDGARAVLRDEPPPRPSRALKVLKTVRGWFWPAPAGLLAATSALLLLMVYQQLEAPPPPEVDAVQPVSLHFLPVARSGTGTTVALPEGHRFLGVTLSASWKEALPRYRVQVQDPQGAVQLSMVVPAPAEGEELKLLLPARPLKPGDYVLVIGSDDLQAAPEAGELARYSFTLEHLHR